MGTQLRHLEIPGFSNNTRKILRSPVITKLTTLIVTSNNLLKMLFFVGKMIFVFSKKKRHQQTKSVHCICLDYRHLPT